MFSGKAPLKLTQNGLSLSCAECCDLLRRIIAGMISQPLIKMYVLKTPAL